MLITKIIAEVDAQLERLREARARIVTLTGQRAAAAALELPSVDAEAAEPEADELHVTGRVAPRARRESRGTRRRREAEPSALSKAIPAGPVVVSAAQIQHRAEARPVVVAKPAEAEPKFESGFDALLREAAARSRAIMH